MQSVDFLIIGAGSAGSVLASRLSEDPKTRVLLIEAGMDVPPEAVPADIADLFPRAYGNPRYFWPSLKAKLREGGPELPYPQARLLGGGSSVMGMWAVRGLAGDYDAWSAHAPQWSYDETLPYFRRLENDLDFQTGAHGVGGPIPVSRFPREQWPEFVRAIERAAGRKGLRPLQDLNEQFCQGIFPLPHSTEGVNRVSAASAYLSAAVRSRKNLEIRTGVEASSLIFSGRTATGARLRRADGRSEEAAARHLIVSAGTIHSPALLLRSGIGAGAALQSTGIKVVADRPEVGENLQNHVFLHFGSLLRPRARQHVLARRYGVACARRSSPLAAPNDPDMFMAFIGRTSGRANGNRLGMIAAALYAPYSRGRVQLKRNDPMGSPDVSFRLLSDERDRSRLVETARFCRDILWDGDVRPLAFETVLLPPNPPIRELTKPGLRSAVLAAGFASLLELPATLRRGALAAIFGRSRFLDAIKSDEQFDALALQSAAPMFHPVGTCAIGSVVDARGGVVGVEGLSVIDASIMPVIPRANTNIPTIMVAEKCAASLRRGVRPPQA